MALRLSAAFFAAAWNRTNRRLSQPSIHVALPLPCTAATAAASPSSPSPFSSLDPTLRPSTEASSDSQFSAGPSDDPGANPQRQHQASEMEQSTTPNKTQAPVQPSSPVKTTTKEAQHETTTDEIEFTMECPAKPVSVRSHEVTDVYVQNGHLDVQDLDITYAIRPGSKWHEMRSFRSMNCECAATLVLLQMLTKWQQR